MKYTKIVPYRISTSELLLLNNLYEIFTKNGFTIGMWPEIYFCDYIDAVANFELQEQDFNDEVKYLFNPDFLGIYHYKLNQEGIIVLFKDRIINTSKHIYFNQRNSFTDINNVITLLKTKVLIHEIGHWLTHTCSTVNKYAIMTNFSFLPKIITESMAQLTVIWSFYKHTSEFEYQLENFARIFMPLQPYPYYEFSNMYHIYSPQILLSRYLGIASQMTHINSQRLFELLSKNESDLSILDLDILKGKRI